MPLHEIRQPAYAIERKLQGLAMAENCREIIISEESADFIRRVNRGPEDLARLYPGVCLQYINDFYTVFYVPVSFLDARERTDFDYESFPMLYTLLENEGLEAGTIIQIQNQPVLQLKGSGVILGFIDTGIDYTNDCFRDDAGNSRILEIWDQTIQSGNLPVGLDYGSVYTREEINEALGSGEPFSVVPSRDEIGHGTQIASIAAGSPDENTGWTGAAPLSDIAMVKLKPAKQYLKRYFMVAPDAEAYQENDIMLGVRYLHELAQREKKPLVICMNLGSNMGGHEGNTPLSSIISTIGAKTGRCVVVAGGNEAHRGHHFYGRIMEGQDFQDVELRVGEEEYGLTMEIWGTTPDELSVAVTSPTGEEVPRTSIRNGNQKYSFLFEKTGLYIDFQLLGARSGDQLIIIRMYAPTPGIWRLRVYGRNLIHRVYNIWLPTADLLNAPTQFLSSNPDITLTGPANTEIPITVAAYQVQNNSIYINSSRGYTRRGRIKPDIAAPGVEVRTVASGNRYTSMTGTSVSAAIVAGAAALLMEWGIVRGNRPTMGTVDIKQLLISGARRSSTELYPNRSWGYGMLDLYATFMEMGRF